MNYCIYLKKRKNKPFCKLENKEISLSLCRECDKKEYKNSQSVKMKSKSKKLAKLEKNRKSVFSNITDKCYFCPSNYNLTWHEIFRGRNRINSIKYGLCLRMCQNCHEEKQEDVYFNDFWHRKAQLYWEEHIGSREEFLSVFKRNYLK